MIAVLFEVWPAEGKTQYYLDLAAALRDDLSRVDGFVSIERFESLSEPGKLLSLSFFRDEEAVALWRNFAPHRATQSKGRSGVFADYRLRVANVLRDYGFEDREQAPTDSRTAHAADVFTGRIDSRGQAARTKRRNAGSKPIGAKGSE